MSSALKGPQHHSESREKPYLPGDCGEPAMLPPLLLLSGKGGVCTQQIPKRGWCLLLLPGKGWALVTRSLGSGQQSHRHTHTLDNLFFLPSHETGHLMSFVFLCLTIAINMVSSSFLNIAANDMISFFLTEYYSFVCMYQFSSFICGCLVRFHIIL